MLSSKTGTVPERADVYREKMRLNVKFILFVLLYLCISCAKYDLDSSKENQGYVIFFDAYSTVQTKGYIEGTSLEETYPQHLHIEHSTVNRSLYLTAYDHPVDREPGEYFCNQRFDKGSDGSWHHSPAIFWPMGANMDFLSYSSCEPFSDDEISWGYGCSTDKLTLTVSNQHTQDDILFSCCLNQNCEGLGTPVSLVYQHSQAWIEFRLRIKDSFLENVVRIDSLAFDDIYTDGVLTVTHPYGYSEGNWSFKYSTAKLTKVDDVLSLYGSVLTTEVSYFDMLLPEQLQKSIYIFYTYMTTPDVPLVKVIDLPIATWQMGKKYVYDLVFNSQGISIVPSVIDWESVSQSADIPNN